MKIVTESESIQWCEEQGFSAPPNLRSMKDRPHSTYGSTQLRQARVAIREVLAAKSRGAVLVWVMDWPLYTPDEMAVVMRWRSSTGENRLLIEAPGHIFNTKEQDDCIGFFNLCMLYLWDVFLLAPTVGVAAFCSHDEECLLLGLDEPVQSQIQTTCDRLTNN